VRRPFSLAHLSRQLSSFRRWGRTAWSPTPITTRPGHACWLHHFRYTLYGKNLASKAYIQGALPSALAHEVIFGAPREIGLKVDWQF
jgi:hypothetical protein